ncbi:MAG: radical SAM protein, partial [candidate division NC10 bacterium]
MSWNLKRKAQTLLASEEGGIRKDWGGKISVALVYPNTYAVGMSNLGFQTVYWHLNQLPDVVCERAFFPDPEDLDEYQRTGTAPFTLESQRPLSDFHLVGFSVTYEGDYINVLRLLAMAGIPLRPEARRPRDPLILMGGVCAFSNPEPIAPFMDFVVVGEGEEIVGEIVAAYREAFEGVDPARRRREAFLDRLMGIQGIYLPHAYRVSYADDGTVAAVRPTQDGVPPIVVKRRLKDVNRFETLSLLKTPRAEYGHMTLLEVGKGCGRGCRFCLEGEIYRPVRHRSLDSLRETVARIAKDSKRIGLVGACVSDYPWIGELMKILEEHGVEVSISSIRADSLTEDLVASLKRGGHRTLTVAPEAGTERLRQVIRKAITDEQLYAACALVRRYGIPNLKCYFMIGLPGETQDDIEAIPDLARRLLERLRVSDPDGRPFGKLTLSISSFVPKPWTPFQWAPFDDVRSLEAKLGIIKSGVRRFSNVRVLHENPREAALQALLARGDRRVADFLEIAAGLGGDWRRALREWEGDPALYATRPRSLEEIFPWDHFDVGVKKAGLIREYQKAEPAAILSGAGPRADATPAYLSG